MFSEPLWIIIPTAMTFYYWKSCYITWKYTYTLIVCLSTLI